MNTSIKIFTSNKPAFWFSTGLTSTICSTTSYQKMPWNWSSSASSLTSAMVSTTSSTFNLKIHKNSKNTKRWTLSRTLTQGEKLRLNRSWSLSSTTIQFNKKEVSTCSLEKNICKSKMLFQSIFQFFHYRISKNKINGNKKFIIA